MENQECKPEDVKKCGCCCGKALIIILVFLIGGIIGYLKGSRCGGPHMCGSMRMPPPVEAGPAAMPPARGK
ncbi:MAG TPA: hypothetical protein DEB40_05290 [Elusimicrobia bacterium]|nr:hypothetical protein [Elusimicrobiota bacterium]HBT61139.1 hypothetical protein [Elusimicrobiota bacterium]